MAKATFKLTCKDSVHYFLTAHGLGYALREYYAGHTVTLNYNAINGTQRQLKGWVSKVGAIHIKYPPQIIDVNCLPDVLCMGIECTEREMSQQTMATVYAES